MEKQVKRPCGSCGSEAIKIVNLKDSWVDEPWKDFPRVYISCDLEQYRCSKCGELAGTRSSAKAFDKAAEESIKDQVSYFINRIKSKTKLRLKEIAERIPMGYQHLSDLRNRRSFPSYHYWGLLYSMYKNPDLLDQFDPRTEDAPLSNFG
jgi:hypothetical protein